MPASSIPHGPLSRIGVISGIHSNLPALQIALQVLKEEKVENIVLCGDIVGYGDSPNECCEMIRALNCPVVVGNHDRAVAGLTEYKYSFSSGAVAGIEYTKRLITAANRAWLKRLPLIYKQDDLVFVHATPKHPDRWHYLKLGPAHENTMWEDLYSNFRHFQGEICFIGHSHTPALFLEIDPKQIKVITPDKPFYQLGGHRAIVDVGSVGHPRDQSNIASLVICDREERTVHFKHFFI
ncbi:MAG: metallophosphoesterase family protein [Deltaproteobacteria bacterium]|nr:metallophosphoesterase family protein [Deltaproteobacteria bacterium]